MDKNKQNQSASIPFVKTHHYIDRLVTKLNSEQNEVDIEDKLSRLPWESAKFKSVFFYSGIEL